jgi:hypothetical protein
VNRVSESRVTHVLRVPRIGLIAVRTAALALFDRFGARRVGSNLELVLH